MTRLFHILVVLLCSTSWVFAQQRTVRGTVTDAQGEPMVGATILVKGTTTATTANPDGSFQLGLPDGATTLVVSFIGSKSKEVVVGDQTSLTIRLESADQNLNEVVVIGYGTARKSDLTGSVGSVRSEQLTRVATPDPVQALQGQVAGVDITSNSGQPGAGTRIRVRGVGTINNSNPLYVVDGFQTGDINFLLPSDIESIEVLKDASATAIYGSRGANGVVVVTTKKGKVGKTQFNVNGFSGYQQIRRTLDLTTAAEYATLVTEAYRNGQQDLPANFTDRFQSAIQNNEAGTDWQDFVLQRGFITNYNLSVSGGTEQNRFLISGGYFQQDGIIPNSGLKKFIVRLNDELVLTKRVKAGIGVSYTRSNNLSGANPVLNGAITANPITVPYTPTGEFAYDDITSFTPNLGRFIRDEKFNRTEFNKLFTNAYVDVTLLEGLSFRSNFGINYDNNHPKIYRPQYFVGPNDQRSISALTETRSENVAWVWSNFVNYNKTLSENSSISATLGQELQRNQGNEISITAFDVPAATDLQYVSAARAANSTTRSSQRDEGLVSYFGRANYNFKDRYLLTGTLRFDQSSKFLPDVRTGVYPSFGAAWRISEESFLKGVTALPALKLRASWGKVGNQNAAPNYASFANAINNQLYIFNNQPAPGIAVAQLRNPDLKWETAVTTNFGLDAELLDSKLTLTADYFIRRTEDMIALLPVADFIGQAPPSANVASLRNRGVEVALNYRDNLGEFRYDVGVNFTAINNEVTSLGGANPLASGNVISQIGNTTLTNVGREIAYFYGLHADGVFRSQEEVDAYTNAANLRIQPNAQPGDVRYRDVNGDGKIDNQDRDYLGSATPDFSYGVNLGLGYGGLDFKVLLYGVQGVQAVNGTGINLEKSSIFAGTWTNFYASRLDRWTPENSNSDQPRVTSRDLNRNDQFSSRHVEEASFLRVRNVELGYSLPTAFGSRYGVGSVRFYASVDNLFTFTNYTGLDPEISASGFFDNPLAYGVDFGNYPQPRTLRLGLNVQF